MDFYLEILMPDVTFIFPAWMFSTYLTLFPQPVFEQILLDQQ